MSVLIPIEIGANYEEDRESMQKLNQHLEIAYLEESDGININLNIAEDDHFINISVSLADLIEAIGKAIKLPE